MKNALFILGITFCFFNANGQINKTQIEKIDNSFSEWNKPNNPGGAIGVVKDGKLIYSKGYGLANLEYDIPFTPKTISRIASTSKQFTAACIILLSQQGQLSFEDKLSKFFPDFPPYANNVTIQHLLNHTSGIRDYLGLKRVAGLIRNEDYFSDIEVKQWITNQKELSFTSGDRQSYSNSGYWLLGQIVKEASGLSLKEYAQKYIFSPLGMNDTHYHDNHKHIVKNRAHGYTPNDKNGFDIKMYHLDMIGDGGVFTTIEDLKKWDDSFYDSKILNESFWNKMTQVGTLNNGVQLGYASGLGIENYRGTTVHRHGGAFAGFRAELIRFPEHRLSVIFLGNRADVDPSRTAFQIADMLLQDEFEKHEDVRPTGNVTPPEVSINAISLTTDQLKVFEGDYWGNDDKISRKLEVRNDTLNYVRGNGPASKMIPVAHNKFQWSSRGEIITITFDSSKKPTKFTFGSAGEPDSEFKVYTPVASFSKSDLRTYAGDYYNSDLDKFYSLRIEENGLILYINGSRIAPLYPLMKNILTNPRQMNLVMQFNKTREEFELSIARIDNLKFVKW